MRRPTATVTPQLTAMDTPQLTAAVTPLPTPLPTAAVIPLPTVTPQRTRVAAPPPTATGIPPRTGRPWPTATSATHTSPGSRRDPWQPITRRRRASRPLARGTQASSATGSRNSSRAEIGRDQGTGTPSGALNSSAGAARVPRAAPNIAFAEYRSAGAAMCLSPRRRPVAPALNHVWWPSATFPVARSVFPGGRPPRTPRGGLRPRWRWVPGGAGVAFGHLPGGSQCFPGGTTPRTSRGGLRPRWRWVPGGAGVAFGHLPGGSQCFPGGTIPRTSRGGLRPRWRWVPGGAGVGLRPPSRWLAVFSRGDDPPDLPGRASPAVAVGSGWCGGWPSATFPVARTVFRGNAPPKCGCRTSYAWAAWLTRVENSRGKR